MTTTPFLIRTRQAFRLLACALVMLLFAHYSLGGEMTADGMATPDSKDSKSAPVTKTEEEKEYKNWITLGVGGMIVNGDEAQFEQEHRMSADDVYGGIEDFHYETSLTKELDLKADGHAMFDANDYYADVLLTWAKVGYLRAGYQQFRSWYDGNGGFFPHHNVWFDPVFPE